MDIINFDKYSSDNNNYVKHHYLLPDCHYMIVGLTGSGKTNLLINMILKWMNYNTCCCILLIQTKININFCKNKELKYSVLKIFLQ